MVDNSSLVKTILKYIGQEKQDEIDAYLALVMERDFYAFENIEQINYYLYQYLEYLRENITIGEVQEVRYYTGRAYVIANAILRNTWNYEKNGQLDEGKKREGYEMAQSISHTISKLVPIGSDIITYRGVGIDAFRDYGVNSIGDFLELKGKYLYDGAFTSTSLIRKNSFFNRDNLAGHKKCNVEIEFYVPSESNDGIILLDDNLSYLTDETEFLINKGSLARIKDVKVDKENDLVYLKAILVPKKIWDPSYQEERDSNRTK